MPIRYPGGVGTPFPDNSPVVLDSDDGTKGVRIDTGSLATGTIAVLTVTASGSFPGAGGTAIDVEGTAVAGTITSLAAAAALTGAELVPVVQTGNTVRTTAQDIANLANPSQFIRTGVQWADTSNNTFSTGTIDVSIAPYNGGANVSNGDAILNAYRVAQTGPNTGIWEVTNVNVGLNQATVVRRADAAIGKPFYAGEFIYDFGSYSTYELEEIFDGASDVANALVDGVNNVFYWTSTPDNIQNLPATGALSGTELVPVMSGAPGVTTQTTTQDIANLAPTGFTNRAAVDWYDQNNSTPSIGTIDTTVTPYNSLAIAGESTAIMNPSAPADAGIWVLGSVAAPAAVPVTRRSDSAIGKTFIQNETVALNSANAIANAATLVFAFPFDPTFSTDQEVAVIGTDIVAFIGAFLSGEYPFIGGGFQNMATSNHTVIAGGINNRSTAQNATVSGGDTNIASGAWSTIAGGDTNTASGGASVIGGGSQNVVTGFRATIAGGNNNIASGDYSHISGGVNGNTRGVFGAEVASSGQFAVSGDAQHGKYVLRGSTVGAVSVQLSSDASASDPTNQITLPNTSSYAFSGRVIAREVATKDTKDFSFTGTIKRDANAAATALMSAVTPNVVNADAGAAAWTVAVTADAVIGCIAVTVTGEAAKTIQWLCDIDTIENVG